MQRQEIIEAIARFELVAFREPSQLVSYDSAEDKFYHRVSGTSHHELLLERELSGCYIASDSEVEQVYAEEEEKRFSRQLGAYLC